MAQAHEPRVRKPQTTSVISEGRPAVCRAGSFQFAAHYQQTNERVQSRALFWCKSGRGEFIVNGTKYTLEPHDLYLLPWNRRITYLPSEKEPMYTVHVHIVPWYRPGSAWVPNVPHQKGDPEFDSPDRRDVNWPVGEGVVRLRAEADEPLGRLIDYTTRWYLQSKRDEAEARALGLLLLREVMRTAAAAAPAQDRPEELRRLLVYVDR